MACIFQFLFLILVYVTSILTVSIFIIYALLCFNDVNCIVLDSFILVSCPLYLLCQSCLCDIWFFSCFLFICQLTDVGFVKCTYVYVCLHISVCIYISAIDKYYWNGLWLEGGLQVFLTSWHKVFVRKPVFRLYAVAPQQMKKGNI